METLLQQLEQIENILTFAAVMTSLCFIFLAWHIIMTWLYYKFNESENYKKYNLEFMNEQNAKHTKIDILHHEINKNNYHVEMELMDIHKELEKLNKKVGKK